MIRFIASSSDTINSDNVFTVPRPTGAAVGDLLFVVIGSNHDNTFDMNAQAGWTQLDRNKYSSAVLTSFIFWRIDNGAAGPFLFNWPAGQGVRQGAAICAAYRNADDTPIDAWTSSESSGQVTVSNSPSITTLGANRLVIRTVVRRGDITFGNASSLNYTKRFQRGNVTGGVITTCVIYDGMKFGAGADGPYDIPGDVSGISISSVVAIKPADLASGTTIYRQSPDAVQSQVGLTGALSNVQDDPDSPDANWLTA
jgi:hypothetical protein